MGDTRSTFPLGHHRYLSPTTVRRTLVLPLLVGALVTCGCQRPNTATDVQKDVATVARTHLERGPVRVTVEVTPAPARLSDEPTLTLTIDHEVGVVVNKPPFGEALGDFIIRDFREPLPEAKGDRQILRQVYTLEPLTTGPLQIDPIAFEFQDDRPHGDGQRHQVETESLTVQVLSVLPNSAPSLDDLEDYAAPVDLPRSRFGWIGMAIAGSLLCVVATVVWMVWNRRRMPATIPLTPRDVARQQLEQLWHDDAARRDVKDFYVRLTAIVRQYIEGTTGVHAPEQTTDEFLREIGAGTLFSRDERQRLKEFLEAADLVKFAAVRPELSSVRESYHRARCFVGLSDQEAAA